MKQTSLFKLFIAAGVAVWAIPYVFTALSNALVPLITIGAVPGSRYTLNPYTMIAAGGFGVAAALTLAATWLAAAAKLARADEKPMTRSSRSSVKVKNVKIASHSQSDTRTRRRLSQQQA